MNDADKIIGKNITSILKSKGLSQSWLADKMDVKAGYLSELINSKGKKRWNTTLLNRVCEALGVRLQDLAEDTDRADNKEERIAYHLEELEREFKEDDFISPLLKSIKSYKEKQS